MTSTVPCRPKLISIRLVGSQPFYRPSVLDAFVGTLETFPEFTPETHSLEEQSSFRFSRKSAVRMAENRPTQHTLDLKRKRSVKHHCMVSLGSHAEASLNIDPKLTPDSWARVFELGEAIFAACQPEILWVHLTADVERPLSAPWQRVQWATNNSPTSARHYYRDFGPAGLTMRTFLGARLIELIGKDLIESTPVDVAEVKGGLRLDLVRKPWQATAEALRDSWQAARQHLDRAQVFADIRVFENGAVEYKAGARFSPPPEHDDT